MGANYIVRKYLSDLAQNVDVTWGLNDMIVRYK